MHKQTSKFPQSSIPQCSPLRRGDACGIRSRLGRAIAAGMFGLMMLGCVDESQGIDPGGDDEPILIEPQSRAITSDEIAAIESAPEFQEILSLLEKQNETVDLSRGEVWSAPEIAFESAIFSVTLAPPELGAGEYTSLTVDLQGGQVAGVSLDLNGDFVPPPPEKHQNLGTCGAWGSWYTVSTYCEWKFVCLGEAKMLHRQRKRTCNFNGSEWLEYENTTVRNKCGC